MSIAILAYSIRMGQNSKVATLFVIFRRRLHEMSEADCTGHLKGGV
jgi:hypothetical protein